MALDGTTLVDGNDEDSTLRVYEVRGGKPRQSVNVSGFLKLSTPTGEADIEAATNVGNLTYWITSHGRNKNAKLRPDRHRLFTTKWVNGGLQPVGNARSDLLDWLLKNKTIASMGLAQAEPNAPEQDGINIEALAAGPDHSLLIGLRSPLDGSGKHDRRALLVPLLNPSAFLAGASPEFGDPIQMDLGGKGFRDMLHLTSGNYIIVAGDVADSPNFALYEWSGRAQDGPTQIKAPFDGFTPEALVELGAHSVLALSDDGTDVCKASGDAQKQFRGRQIAIP